MRGLIKPRAQSEFQSIAQWNSRWLIWLKKNQRQRVRLQLQRRNQPPQLRVLRLRQQELLRPDRLRPH
jgi:hypothetical protein